MQQQKKASEFSWPIVSGETIEESKCDAIQIDKSIADGLQHTFADGPIPHCAGSADINAVVRKLMTEARPAKPATHCDIGPNLMQAWLLSPNFVSAKSPKSSQHNSNNWTNDVREHSDGSEWP